MSQKDNVIKAIESVLKRHRVSLANDTLASELLEAVDDAVLNSILEEQEKAEASRD